MIIPIGTLDIQTDRLLLRRFTAKDAPHIFINWASNPNVTKYLDWLPHKDLSETNDILNKWLAAYDSGFYFNWAITLLQSDGFAPYKSNEISPFTTDSIQKHAYLNDGVPIGAIGLNSVDIENESGEIGFILSEDYWNRNITTEAFGFSLNYLFETACFKQISARTSNLNINSKKILHNFGFEFISDEYILMRQSFKSHAQ